MKLEHERIFNFSFSTFPSICLSNFPLTCFSILPLICFSIVVCEKFILFYKPQKNKTIFYPEYEYFKSNQKKMICSSNNKDKYNSNIENIFYDKEKYFDIINNKNNEIEKIWRTRILIESTPRGNIIMFYDPYKLGFSYYSDTNGIPYSILNAVAMKYIYTFRCLNFFVDNKLTYNFLDKFESPLISLYFTEETKTKKLPNFDNKNSPFVKYKNQTQTKPNMILFGNKIGIKNKYPTINQPILFIFYNTKKFINYIFIYFKNKLFRKIEKKVVDIKEKIDEKEYNFNRFIYLGKTSNFQFLKFNPKYLSLNGFHSNLLENLNQETKLQKEVMNYNDYKKMIKIE
jgi:hypothetical protein